MWYLIFNIYKIKELKNFESVDKMISSLSEKYAAYITENNINHMKINIFIDIRWYTAESDYFTL